MMYKRALQAIDQMLRDIRNSRSLTEGLAVDLSGDFRQILLVIPKRTKADEIRACWKSSILWKRIKTIKRKTNLRAILSNYRISEEFPQRLLFFGKGGHPVGNKDCLKLTSVSTLVQSGKELMSS